MATRLPACDKCKAADHTHCTDWVNTGPASAPVLVLCECSRSGHKPA